MIHYLDRMCQCRLHRQGALVEHQYTYVPPLCRSEYRRTFVPLSLSLWNDLADPVFDGVELVSFKSRANGFLLA